MSLENFDFERARPMVRRAGIFIPFFILPFISLISLFPRSCWHIPRMRSALRQIDKIDKEDLKQLRNRIETLQKELADTEESRSEVADTLQDSERAISAATRQLNTLAQEKHKASNKLSQLQSQSEQVTGNIEVQQSHLGKLLYRQYMAGSEQKEYLELLLNQQEP